MHHVAKVQFGPSPTQIKAETESKKPLLRYLVDRREGFAPTPPFEFLNSTTDYLHSPFSLPDIYPALELLYEKANKGETILLYGDRDADGVTSSCLLGFFLKKHPPFSKSQIHVFTATDSDPYGLSEPVMKKIKALAPSLLVTLDFGSSQPNEIEELLKLGTQVIVLDHHEIPTRIPLGSYCINPRRLDSKYPEKKICTATLALKIIQALLFYHTEEFNKVYLKEDSGSKKYFQNGIELQAEIAINQVINDSFPLYPFPKTKTKTDPVDDERFLFACQTQSIPEYRETIQDCADLAGIGTVTDLMPLSSENRHIVKLGLQSLQNLYHSSSGERRPGLFWLMKALNLTSKGISAKDLGWGIGPALNAAGRMGKTEVAVQLLLSEDAESAKQKANDLLKLNAERKDRTKRNLDRVERYFKRKPEKAQEPLAFCYEPDMEPGVSGIVATKMTEDFKKVAVFISPDNGDGRGSIRAYQRENVLDFLNAVSEHLLHFGGHPEAGGFSVSLSKIPDLETALYSYGNSLNQNPKKDGIDYTTDLTVLPEELNDALPKEWKDLEPFGQGNPDIRIGLKQVRVYHLNPLSGGKHIRFHIIGSGVKCLLWNKGEIFERFASETDTMDIIGHLEKNFFQGKESLQFVVDWFGKAEAV